MRLPVHIWIREENANPEELAGYFTEIARRLDAHPQKMRLVIESTVPVCLDFDPEDGDPVVSVGGLERKFRIRRRWIPEHPVPLAIGAPHAALRRIVLLIDPVEENRFRVRARREVGIPAWLYALFAVAAVAAAVSLHPAAISAAAAILACLAGIKVVRAMS